MSDKKTARAPREKIEFAFGSCQKKSWGPQEIKAFRDRLGYSQTQMAELLGISFRTVSAWESGARKPEAPAEALLSLIEDLAAD